MKKLVFLALLALAFCTTFSSCKDSSSDSDRVILGNEQFTKYIPLLAGKRVALFSNHTGIVGDKIILSDGTVQYGGFLPDSESKTDASLIHFGTDSTGGEITYGKHVLDALYFDYKMNMVAIFCPEHGFRGTEDAGADISNDKDEKTGVPILSLYANDQTTAPSEEDMAKFDTLVVDMQDVGLRYYTYYIALYYLMDACASHDKEVIILDRPNPNGFYVDGGILEEDYISNVGRLPIPTVYGMTWGELAKMINGEGWLTAGKNACKLTVIPLKNYTHQTKYALIRAPSPNIKDMRAVYLYASTCFFENTLVSVGRGTTFPFEAYGSPIFEKTESYDFTFTPQSMAGATEPQYMNEKCYGVDLRGVSVNDIWNAGINVEYIVNAYNDCPSENKENFWGKDFGTDDNEVRWIDRLSGSSALREQIVAGKTAKEIKQSWQSDIEKFKAQRKKYLLYKE